MIYLANLIYIPSDKSSGVVLMNTEDYKLEIEKKLNHNDIYKTIDTDLKQKNKNKVKKPVENVCKIEIIDKT